MGERLDISRDVVSQQVDPLLPNMRTGHEKQRKIRQAAFNAFHRELLGNEKPNRCQVVTSDVADAVESLMPPLSRQFLSSDDKVKITGPDITIAKALRVQARDDITELGGFELIHDVFKDALTGDNGSSKCWWTETLAPPEIHVKDRVDQRGIDAINAHPEMEILSQEYVDTVMVQKEVPGVDPLTGAQVMMLKPAPTNLYRVEVKWTKIEKAGPAMANLPPDELMAHQNKRRINDKWPVAHRKKITYGELLQINEEMPTKEGEQFFSNLKEVLERSPDNKTAEDQEREDREAPFVYSTAEPEGEEDLGSEVEFVELYCNLTIGKKLKRSIVWLGNGIVMRVEENKDGFIPISTWSPILNTHRMFGTSTGSTHVDFQHVSTALTRSVIDSVGFSIDKARMVQDFSADLLGLQDLYPGKHVNVDFNQVQEIDISPVSTDVFKLLEHLKSSQEGRGPTNRFSEGLQGDPTNKTATGISLIQRAAFSKIDFISLIFAEVYLADKYQKLIYLYQQNLRKPIDVVVDGKTVTLTRENIQGDYKAKASLGIEVDFDEREFSKLMTIISMVLQIVVLPIGQVMFPADKIHALFKRLFMAAGYRDADELMNAPPPQTPVVPGTQPQPGGGAPDRGHGAPTAVPDDAIAVGA